MSAPFLCPLRLSPLLQGVLLLLHGVPPLCALAPGVPSWLAPPLWGASLLSGLWQLKRARNLGRLAMQGTAHGECFLLEAGLSRPVEILPDSRDMGWLIVLVWRDPESGVGGRAALTRDGQAFDAWRALRRHLRWGLRS